MTVWRKNSSRETASAMCEEGAITISMRQSRRGKTTTWPGSKGNYTRFARSLPLLAGRMAFARKGLSYFMLLQDLDKPSFTNLVLTKFYIMLSVASNTFQYENKLICVNICFKIHFNARYVTYTTILQVFILIQVSISTRFLFYYSFYKFPFCFR